MIVCFDRVVYSITSAGMTFAIIMIYDWLMTVVHKNTLLTFPLFREWGIPHFITTRQGGVSRSPFDSLNLSFLVPDRPEDVGQNRARLASSVGIDPGQMVFCRQTHGVGIHQVTPADRGAGSIDPSTAIPSCDGLITGQDGICCMILVADCVPLLLADPDRGVVAAVHAGRRGIQAGIVQAAVSAFITRYESQAVDLIAGIGPCIGLCCYEVDPESAGSFCYSPRTGSRNLDLSGAVKHICLDMGISPGSINCMDECTACLPDKYFSHRGSRGTTGRFAAGIMVGPLK